MFIFYYGPFIATENCVQRVFFVVFTFEANIVIYNLQFIKVFCEITATAQELLYNVIRIEFIAGEL